MSIVRTMARLAPPSVVNWLGRLQFQVPALAPLIHWAAASVRRGEAIIPHGVGKGLRFDAAGAHPGYALGTTELTEQQLLAASLKPGDTFYDIGANVGFYTTLGGRIVGPGGHVYGFEPFPESAAAARGNAARNGFAHVEILQVAVSAADGTGAFLVNGPTTLFHLRAPTENPAPSDVQIGVRVITIDGMVSRGELHPPNFVMIDVEGGELEVLRGMRETALRYLPTIVCEVHWMPGTRFTAELGQIFGDSFWSIKCLDFPSIPMDAERYHLQLTPICRVAPARPVDLIVANGAPAATSL